MAALGQMPADLEAIVETDLGTFRFEFAPDKAPKHVEAFIARARQGYYNGSAFHRAVANGIIQGGDPLLKNSATPKAQWGSGGLSLLAPEYSDMKHERGTISTVAIPGRANSEGAQFFVCVGPQPQLDGKFTTFGRVSEGIEVVQKISQSPLDSNGLIDKPVRIVKVTIEKKREDPYLNATPDQMRKTVTLKTTLGNIKIKMEPDWAPNHVRAFLMLSQTGWYNGTVFHRVVRDPVPFVVQGGDPASADPKVPVTQYGMGDYVDPATGEQVVIEMNPRVSRSSALASKATGFPIAKIAAKLAVGYTLDEITNDITKATPASFEPSIDYVVTKIPRWAFEKLPGTKGVLGTQMQSVGEAMSIGRTFTESLQKALRSLEQSRSGLNADPGEGAFDALDDADGLGGDEIARGDADLRARHRRVRQPLGEQRLDLDAHAPARLFGARQRNVIGHAQAVDETRAVFELL